MVVLSTTEIRSLMEIGFLACGAGNINAAKSIFLGLQTVRPNDARSFIGLAMSCIEAGSAQDAVSILRAVAHLPLAASIEFKIFFAISLVAAARFGEAERELNRLIVEFPSDCPERRLAKGLLLRPRLNTTVVGSPRSVLISE